MKSVKKPSRSRTIEETLSNKTLASLLAPHPRVRVLRPGPPDPERKCVVYWMQRAQRGVDNPALNMTIALGNAVGQPVLAVFSLTADYPGAQRRHYRFLVEGLVDAERDLMVRGVPLVVRLGRPGEVVPALIAEMGAPLVVGDENPVRQARPPMARAAELRHRAVHELREHTQEVQFQGVHRVGRREGEGARVSPEWRMANDK